MAGNKYAHWCFCVCIFNCVYACICVHICVSICMYYWVSLCILASGQGTTLGPSDHCLPHHALQCEWETLLRMPGQVWCLRQAISCDSGGLPWGGLRVGWDVTPKKGHPSAPANLPIYCLSLCVAPFPWTQFYFIHFVLAIDFWDLCIKFAGPGKHLEDSVIIGGSWGCWVGGGEIRSWAK